MPTERLYAHIGAGAGSQIEFVIYVENGRVFSQTENNGYAFLRKGPETTTREITLHDLKNSRVRGGQYYEAAKAEVERQLKLMSEDAKAVAPRPFEGSV
jgi:hypothetical protein